jgi:RimJ/RimL family protein N-acetyltransferase
MLTLQTVRLTLMALDREHLELALNDPTQLADLLQVRIVPGVFSEESRQAMMIKMARMDHIDRRLHPWYTYFLLVTRTDRQALGVCGFKGAPTPFGSVEVGYAIHEDFRNHGYMTEAVEGLIAWAFRQESCRRVTAETLTKNIASQRVLQKAGMILDRSTEHMLYWKIDKNELLEVREAMEQRDRLKRELTRAENRLIEERNVLAKLRKQLDAEDADVRRLEGLSLSALFYSVMGTKDDRLEEERRELLRARLKHESHKHQVESLERDITALKQRLVNLKDLPQRYEELLADKERKVKSGGSEGAERLDAILIQLARTRDQEREVREALQAGGRALTALNRVIDSLESAKNWGTWDILGGGMLASAVKHSRLDDADTAVREAEPLLQRFERELADVDSQMGMAVEAGGLTAFADIFIDNLLIDLLVQSRINDSLDTAEKTAAQVSGILDRLKKNQEELHRQSQRLESERRSLLENL